MSKIEISNQTQKSTILQIRQIPDRSYSFNRILKMTTFKINNFSSFAIKFSDCPARKIKPKYLKRKIKKKSVYQGLLYNVNLKR